MRYGYLRFRIGLFASLYIHRLQIKLLFSIREAGFRSLSMTLNLRFLDPNSESSSRFRTVTGLPITGIRSGEYARKPALEMLSGDPYCPFRADIFQLGTMFNSCFGVRVSFCVFLSLLQLSSSQHLRYLSEPLVDLFDTMCSEDPSARSTASRADISKMWESWFGLANSTLFV